MVLGSPPSRKEWGSRFDQSGLGARLKGVKVGGSIAKKKVPHFKRKRKHLLKEGDSSCQQIDGKVQSKGKERQELKERQYSGRKKGVRQKGRSA